MSVARENFCRMVRWMIKNEERAEGEYDKLDEAASMALGVGGLIKLQSVLMDIRSDKASHKRRLEELLKDICGE